MVAKCAIQTAKPEIVQATESLQGFAGQKSGREAAIQAMSKIFMQIGRQTHASNAFNS